MANEQAKKPSRKPILKGKVRKTYVDIPKAFRGSGHYAILATNTGFFRDAKAYMKTKAYAASNGHCIKPGDDAN